MQRLALAFPATAFLPGPARAADAVAPDEAESGVIAGIAREFMEKYGVPGLSVAFSLGDRVSYAAGFGLADEAEKEKMTPKHLFRIASIAKPVTAVAIYKLVEDGQLATNRRVFGKDGLLPAPGKPAPGLEDITVHQLLTHTCGGWGNERDDPMFMHADLGHRELIATTLRERPLERAPGEHYAYSNFGYCLLGRVIEEVSGRSYEDYVSRALLKRCGIKDMKIAGNTREDRAKDEVIYYGRNGEDPYRMNVRRMDSHGGWLATPEDIVRIFMNCPATGSATGLLRENTVEEMLAVSTANPGYASGWAVNKARHRWHAGSLPGATTIAVRTAGGMCWAGFANSRSGDINLALDQMMWRMAKAVPAWNA